MSNKKRLMSKLDQALDKGMCFHADTDAERQCLRRLVKNGEVASPIRGMFVNARSWEALNRRKQTKVLVKTLSAQHPDWVFCGTSAAVIHGLNVSYRLLDHIHIAVNKSRHGRDTGIVVRHAMDNVPVTKVGGIRVTSLDRTVLDCLRETSFADGLPIADSALRITGRSRDEFLDRLRTLGRGLHGIRQALYTMSYADPRSENGGESLARAIMIELGFAIPELQVVVESPLGDHHVYRPDFMWRLPDGIVYGELDGKAKYVDPSMTKGKGIVGVLTEERLRESRLSASGRVMRFSYADLVNPERLARLLTAFGIPRVHAPMKPDFRPAPRRGVRLHRWAGPAIRGRVYRFPWAIREYSRALLAN